jgi:hypothetical protein
MNITYQDYLGSLCEFSSDTFHAELSRFDSWRGRIECLKILVRKAVCLPFGLAFKLGVTLCRSGALFVGLLGLFFTFEKFSQSYEYFIRRFVLLARDLADWVALPFLVFFGFIRLLLGIVHPAFYFR